MSFDALESSTYGGAPFELYRFTMGSDAYHLTSGEETRDYLGQTYGPEAIERTEVEHNQETSSGTITVTLPLESSLAKEFISFVPPFPMWLTIFVGHDGDDDVVVHFRGKVQQVEYGTACVMTVESGTSAIRKKIPPIVYQQSCNRIHYSGLCGALTTGTGTVLQWSGPVHLHNSYSVKVSQINDFQVVIDPGAPESAVYVSEFSSSVTPFKYPEDVAPTLAWGMASSSDGRRMMIAKQTVWDRFELKAPIVGLQVGDVLTVTRGCRRTLKHCQFYGQVSQFMGFDLMPSTNPFSGVM